MFALEGWPEVRHAIEDDLVARRDQLAWQDVVPHRERVVNVRVAALTHPGPNTLILTLAPLGPADALCQFMPGQYLEILPPEAGWLARAYSIGNAPRDDGSVELQLRRVEGGRLTGWLFERLREGDVVKARGSQGHFTFRSELGTPLVFVAGGTGFAPIKTMIEQQLALGTKAQKRFFWGTASREDLYELDVLHGWAERDPGLRMTLAIDHGPLPERLPAGVDAVQGTVAEALATRGEIWSGHDAYIAGPPAMMTPVVDALVRAGIGRDRIFVDSFGV